MSDSVLGRPLWYELLTTDMHAAGAFYSAVVGWTITPFEGGAQPYDMFVRADGRRVAGVMRIPEGMNFLPHWEMYVGVPALEDAVTRIERAGGGALSQVIEVPTVGRLRTMRDPQGAVFALYEPAMAPDAEAEPVVGDASWHELYTTDAEGALKFYSDLFGWKQTGAFDMGPTGTYRVFGRSFELGGMMTKPPEMSHVPTAWSIYFRVPDAQSAAERVKEHGGRVLNGPMEVPGGDWIVQCLDPQGAAFSLHHKKMA